MPSAILQPVVVLACWTLVMLVWLLALRLPALKAAGISLGTLVGGKGTDADRALPAQTQWPAHNYNHLLEQPTIFYALTLTMAVIGGAGGIAVSLGWGYAVLRIAHSLVQATLNRVAIRFARFVLSSICLAGLALCALVAVF